ncbi:MAG: prepilin peptidase, partial [Patescibacteria group bacterium]
MILLSSFAPLEARLLTGFVFGLVFGSFLNVVIYRLKTRQNIVFGGSFCPECKNKLKWRDLFPLLSFIFLHGRCRYCDKTISWQYPIVEILSGLIWVLIWKLGFGTWD